MIVSKNKKNKTINTIDNFIIYYVTRYAIYIVIFV